MRSTKFKHLRELVLPSLPTADGSLAARQPNAMPRLVDETKQDDAIDETAQDDGVRVVSIPVSETAACRAVISGSVEAAPLTILTLCGIKGGTRGPLVGGPDAAGLYDGLGWPGVAVAQLEYRKAGASQFAGNIADALAAVDFLAASVVGHSRRPAAATTFERFRPGKR